MEGGCSAGAMLASSPRYGRPLEAASCCASCSTGPSAAAMASRRQRCAASSTLPPPPLVHSAAACLKARCSSGEFSVPMAKPPPPPSGAAAAGKKGMPGWQLKLTPNRKDAAGFCSARPWMVSARSSASACPMPGCQLQVCSAWAGARAWQGVEWHSSQPAVGSTQAPAAPERAARVVGGCCDAREAAVSEQRDIAGPAQAQEADAAVEAQALERRGGGSSIEAADGRGQRPGGDAQRLHLIAWCGVGGQLAA